MGERVKSSQVKFFFNDGLLNKHFTCFFLHQAIRTINYEREKEREVRGGGGGGELQERTNKMKWN